MRILTTILAVSCSLILAVQPAQAERIKDIGSFGGLRANQLVGYGVVVGLAGTGDDSLEYATPPASRGLPIALVSPCRLESIRQRKMQLR